MYARFNFKSLLSAMDTKIQPSSSTIREMAVAIATPVAPSFGAPNKPKINTAFNRMLSEKARMFNTMETVTLPMLRSIAR